MLGMSFQWLLTSVIVTVVFCLLPLVSSASKGQRVLSSPDIPITQFTCIGRPPGYYADLETGCQVYHMCTAGGGQFSYKCPNTTLFQQRMLICAHWYQVNCSRSEQHYGANLLIGQRNKPFVDDLSISSAGGKQLKTLQNPDSLQNLGHTGKDNLDKSHAGSVNIQTNKGFQNTFKRDGESNLGTIRSSNFAGTSFQNTPSASKAPVDVTSLPLAGSVLPGGLKSIQTSQFYDNKKKFSQPSQTTTQFSFSPSPQSFPGLSQTTPKPSIQTNFDATSKAPVRYSIPINENSNNFQPSLFNVKPTPAGVFNQQIPETKPNLDFQPPSDKTQDLTLASQENIFSDKVVSAKSPSMEVEGNLPDTDVKASIEPSNNGSYPDDKYNTFINRFNPYEEAPVLSEVPKDTSEGEVQHVFINRFVPSFGPSLTEVGNKASEDHVFIDRFVLTPEEIEREKNRQNINQTPQDQQVTVSFPTFDLTPPFGDSDDSESNKIELHLPDSRRNLFIPDVGDYDDFSKGDAAPIIVSIPLRVSPKSPPMWFRTDKSNDPCSRCHPAFIINKDTCLPCVIIR